MRFYRISEKEYQEIEKLSRSIQRNTRGCRQQLKSYGESMIRSAIAKRIDAEEIPDIFFVLVLKNANAGRGNYGDYYKTVDIFSGTKANMHETACFISFGDRRVKKENILSFVF